MRGTPTNPEPPQHAVLPDLQEGTRGEGGHGVGGVRVMARLINLDDTDDIERRMIQARRRASYELGDADWAGVIVGAFLHPDEDRAMLESDMDR